MTEGDLIRLEDAIEVFPGLAESAEELLRASKAGATLRAYQSDWADFETWTGGMKVPSLPAAPETVVVYLTALHQRGMKISTIRRRVATISQAHQHAGFDPPTRDRRVRALLQGIARTSGSAPLKKKAVGIGDLRAMAAVCPSDSVKGRRDRALLLLGFTSALRRSELVSLDVEDLEFLHDDGMIITLRRSKTDQEGKGRRIGVPIMRHPETCPVTAVRRWLDVSGLVSGPLFRPLSRDGSLRSRRLTSHAVAVIVKELARSAGLNAGLYSGHSLRSGFATSASRAGAGEGLIARQTGHRSVAMLREYIQEGDILKNNAATFLDL